MGFLSRLFSKGARIKEGALAGSVVAVDETERVYRNQLRLIDYQVSAVGLYKARLFTAGFMLSAYVAGEYAYNGPEEDKTQKIAEILLDLKEVARRPFNNRVFKPQFHSSDDTDFALDFIVDVYKKMTGVLTGGLIAFGDVSQAVPELEALYLDCIRDSIFAPENDSSDDKTFGDKYKDDIDTYCEAAVRANMRLAMDTLEALK